MILWFLLQNVQVDTPGLPTCAAHEGLAVRLVSSIRALLRESNSCTCAARSCRDREFLRTLTHMNLLHKRRFFIMTLEVSFTTVSIRKTCCGPLRFVDALLGGKVLNDSQSRLRLSKRWHTKERISDEGSRKPPGVHLIGMSAIFNYSAGIKYPQFLASNPIHISKNRPGSSLKMVYRASWLSWWADF